MPDFSKIFFGDKTYNIDHTLTLYKKLNFYDPATLKRENQLNYFLTPDATWSSTKPSLNWTLESTYFPGIILKNKSGE